MRSLFVLPVAALIVLTGTGCGGNGYATTNEFLTTEELIQRFQDETGDVLLRPQRGGGDLQYVCFCFGDGGDKSDKYGRFFVNVFSWQAVVEPEKMLRPILGEKKPDDEGVRWSRQRERPGWGRGPRGATLDRVRGEEWVAVKQYAANVVVVWQGGLTKADARWKRLDGVLTRITSAA